MLLFSAPLHSLRKTRFFRWLLGSKLNRPQMCNLGFNHEVALRPFTHASIRWGRKRREPNIRKIMQSICRLLDERRDRGFFFDVGANVGLYSWEMRQICPNRKIIAFEPDPKNLEFLQLNVQTNCLAKIEIISSGLSNVSEQASFFQDELTSATGTLDKENKPWVERYLNGSAKEILVKTTTMDEIVKQGKQPSLVKIDVEGHEIEVLEGSNETLAQAKPLLIIESFPPKQNRVIKILQSKGYEFIDADHSSHVNKNTHNLFAWHSSGPLNKKDLQIILSA